jgi:hypothetical protein
VDRESLEAYAGAAIEFGETLRETLDAGFDATAVHEKVLGNVAYTDSDGNPRDPLEVWREMTSRLNGVMQNGGAI